jgi:ketosteroid isomerase-like protein
MPSGDPRADAARYAGFFENLTRNSLTNLTELTTPDLRFRDPFHDAVGRDAMQAILDKMFRQLANPRFRVIRTVVDGDTAFLEWLFTAKTRRGRDWHIEGVTRLRFDGTGRVIEHIDYWDAAAGLYEHLRAIGWLVRCLRRRISGSGERTPKYLP